MTRYILGVGCRRGVSCNLISDAVEGFLNENNISIAQVALFASCDLKNNELGLLEFLKKNGSECLFFSKDELKDVEVPTPSDRVFSKIGASSVCEAAVILAGGELMINKRKYHSCITLAAGVV